MGRRRRWVILGIVLVGLITSVLAALIATRYYPAYRSALAARDDLQEAQALLRDRRLDASPADLATAEAKLGEAERGFRHTRRAFDDPLIRAAQHLPLLGDSLQATLYLTEIGMDGAQLGRDAVTMSRIYQRHRDEREGALTERTNEILSDMDPPMMAIKERLQGIREKRDRVTGAALPPPLASAVQEMDGNLAELDELVQTYEDLSAFVPDFLGFNGPRTYLVLAQNNAELLPTGGLISVYGVITIQEGRIEEKLFEDAIKYGARWLERSDTYVEPPAPLKRYLLKNVSWNLAVSNWSPNFPTAAQDAERLFQLAGGQSVDGVIAINVHTIEQLLQVTGPIAIEPYGVTVTAENALDVIEEHTRTALEPDMDRKAFVSFLAEELLSRLMHTPPEQWTPLLEALERLRDGHDLLLFSHDREVQMLAQRLGLDGALKPSADDYLMLVDASVNSTKLNIALEQRVAVAVRIDALGDAHHQVTVTYRNNLPAWSEGRDPDLVRRLMLGGLYGGYVRLLAPDGSQLESIVLAGREVGPEEIRTEEDKALFGRFFTLPSGDAADLAFRYTTPFVARPADGRAEYRLYLQKQPGTGAIPVSLRLVLPDGARLLSAELDGTPVETTNHIETDLTKDRELIVRYRPDR